MKRKLTIRKLLLEGKTLRFVDVPFYRELIHHAPEEIFLDPTLSCQEILSILEEKKATRFLNTVIESILVDDENKRIRCLIRWSFFFGLIGSFGTLLAILYQFIVSGVQPDGWLVAVLVGIPAGIMWTQAGVLKSENAMSVSKIIDAFKPGRRRSESPPQQYEQQEYRPPYQSPSYYDEDNNGNPYK